MAKPAGPPGDSSEMHAPKPPLTSPQSLRVPLLSVPSLHLHCQDPQSLHFTALCLDIEDPVPPHSTARTVL